MVQIESNWNQRARLFFQTLADLAFPPVCVACRKPDSLICKSCRDDIAWLSEAFCPYCLKTKTAVSCCDGSLDGLYTAVSYIGPIPKAIHHLKYEGHFAVAQPLAEIMMTAWQDRWPFPQLIIPIPLHQSRQKKRNYNQSELLAKNISKKWPIELNTNALFRIRQTTPQVGLNAHERQSNVNNAFWASDAIKNKTILLIDDVFTTGATMHAAATSLKLAGAKHVFGFTLAKANLP